MFVSKSKKRRVIKNTPTSLNSYGRVRKYNSKNIKKKNTKGIGSNFFSEKFNKTKMKKILYISAGIAFFLICTALIVVGVYLKGLQNSLF